MKWKNTKCSFQKFLTNERIGQGWMLPTLEMEPTRDQQGSWPYWNFENFKTVYIKRQC